MTHIFISYCHKDRDSLDLLLQALKDNELDDEVWFDDDIEAGNQWIPQIDTALREAYALIVIVTPDSMASTYVTYEWSAALGSSTTIFPLLLKGDYNDVHKRLLLEEVVDCRKIIPNSLIDLIKSKRSTPPDINFLNHNISKVLMRVRIASLVALWFHGQIKVFPEDNRRFQELVNGMLDEIRDLYSVKLPELVISRAYAFNQKQLRMCRSLIVHLQNYWQIFKIQIEDYSIYVDGSYQDAVPRATEYWDKNLVPIINFFNAERHFDEDAYAALEVYLSELAQNETNHFHFFFDPTVIINWTYKDDDYGKLLQETLQIILARANDTSSSNIQS